MPDMKDVHYKLSCTNWYINIDIQTEMTDSDCYTLNLASQISQEYLKRLLALFASIFKCTLKLLKQSINQLLIMIIFCCLHAKAASSGLRENVNLHKLTKMLLLEQGEKRDVWEWGVLWYGAPLQKGILTNKKKKQKS